MDNETSQWHVRVHDGGLNFRRLVVDLHIIISIIRLDHSSDTIDDVLGQVRLVDAVIGDEAGLAAQVRDAELVILAGATVLKAHTGGGECEEMMPVTLVGGHDL